MKPDYPRRYSLVHLTYIDGTTQDFTISAGIGVGKYLSDELAQSGQLRLHNDRETLVVMKDQLRSFEMRQLTLDE